MKSNYVLPVVIAAVFMFLVYIIFTPSGVSRLNSYSRNLRMAHDESSYSSLRAVEDQCRMMIASYTSDKMTYEMYCKDGRVEWSNMAKMRANKTVAEYNEFILKNRHYWSKNVPDDIFEQLEYIK